MINLLPLSEKKRIRSEYFARFSIIFLELFLCLVAASSVLLLPSYFLSSVKEQVALENLEKYKTNKNPELEKSTNELIKNLNKKISVFSVLDTKLLSSTLIADVLSRAGEEVKVTELFFEKKLVEVKSEENKDADSKTNNSKKKQNVKMEEIKQMSVSGIAKDRDGLLNFVRELEKEPSFSNVDLPISNFTQSRDIDFNLTITIV